MVGPDKTSFSSPMESTPSVIKAIYGAKTLSDISKTIVDFNKSQPFQIVHIGIFCLDNVLIRDVIHSCPFEGLQIQVDDFSEELKWGVCVESELQLKPFDLLKHEFKSLDTRKFKALRKTAAQSGLKEIMIIPMKIKNSTTVVIINFPLGDYLTYAGELLPRLFQIMIAIYEVFPKLLAWSTAGKLTPRESQILSLSAVGLTESAIANQCGISVNTVRNHVENSKMKLKARNKLHAVMIASGTNEIVEIARLDSSVDD